MKALAERFAGRRVLVTGHTGFKGSWLALWLHHWGARVSGLSLEPPTTPNLFTDAGVAACLEHHLTGDVGQLSAVTEALEKVRPELIFHLAAQSMVLTGYRTPLATMHTNVMGVANLLEGVRQAGRPCAVVVVTTDKCYENREQVWGYRECDPMGGDDPYSASKGAAELVVHAWRRSYFPPERLAEHGVAVASARAGNVIGGGDWADNRIVPDIVRAMRRGERPRLRRPYAVRPWQHVLDPLHGYLLLGSRLMQSGNGAAPCCGGWNFAPSAEDCERTVGQLTDAFLAAFGQPGWERDAGQHPHEAHLLRLAIDKAVVELGWRPRWDAATAIRRTAQWYGHYRPGPGAMAAHCLADIEAFLAGD